MGLLQAAYRTYECQSHLAGVPLEGQETLAPVFHIVQNAHIEVTLTASGSFLGARALPKTESKTLIPITEESASRTVNCAPHPLSDQLSYLAAYDTDKWKAYLAQLTAWAESAYTHPKVRAILHYSNSRTMPADLQAAGILTLSEQGKFSNGKIEGTAYDKCLVRWRVLGAPEGSPTSCWEDLSLIHAFINFYGSRQAGKALQTCILSGQPDVPAVSHPKGVVSANFGAKLISSNDHTGFTYRGRFTDALQVGAVGYTASQKAHSALRWLTVNHGVVLGGRTFLWWNPDGKELPRCDDFLGVASATGEQNTFISYKQQLLQSFGGYRNTLNAADSVVVATLDAATTGRLSVTYYNDLRAEDFLNRLQDWYLTCCWNTRYSGVQSPSLKRIVQCAFGTQRDTFIEVDERILREHVQQLLHCIIDRCPIPADIVGALAARASQPLAYKTDKPNNREILLSTACAVVRKYRNTRAKKEEWTLALDESNPNRSYLYGRLLAIAEQVERSTYGRDETREPNAIRIQTVFSQRPAYAWRILYEALDPYFKRLSPGLRNYYKNMIQAILNRWTPDTPDLNHRLEDIYLLGYYHQRAALTRKKENNTETEGQDYESVEE